MSHFYPLCIFWLTIFYLYFLILSDKSSPIFSLQSANVSNIIIQMGFTPLILFKKGDRYEKILSFVRATNPKLMFFLLIFFPAFLSALFSFLSLFSFRNLYKESLKSSYSSMLQVFSENEENTISGISNSIKVLSEDTLFFNTVSGQDNSANGISHLQSIIKNSIELQFN